MAFPLALALGIAGSLASLGGAKAASSHPYKLDPALFGAPDPSLLNPVEDPGFNLVSQLLGAQAQQRFAGQVPQIASLLQARGLGGSSGIEADLLGNAYNAATASTIPQIAALLAQSRQLGYGRYMSQIDAARRAQLLQSQQHAQQQASLSGGLFGLGGSLLGAALNSGKGDGSDGGFGGWGGGQNFLDPGAGDYGGSGGGWG